MLAPPGVEVGQSGHGALEVELLHPVERELASSVDNAGLELDGASYPVNNIVHSATATGLHLLGVIFQGEAGGGGGVRRGEQLGGGGTLFPAQQQEAGR